MTNSVTNSVSRLASFGFIALLRVAGRRVADRREAALFACFRRDVKLLDLLPVHNIPPRIHVVGPLVLVLEVVGRAQRQRRDASRSNAFLPENDVSRLDARIEHRENSIGNGEFSDDSVTIQ